MAHLNGDKDERFLSSHLYREALAAHHQAVADITAIEEESAALDALPASMGSALVVISDFPPVINPPVVHAKRRPQAANAPGLATNSRAL